MTKLGAPLKSIFSSEESSSTWLPISPSLSDMRGGGVVHMWDWEGHSGAVVGCGVVLVCGMQLVLCVCGGGQA